MKWNVRRLFISYQVISGIFVFIISMPLLWGLIFPLSSYLDGNWYGALKYSLSTVTAVLIMYFIWGKSSFSIKCPNYFKGLFSFGLLGVIGAAGAFVVSRDKVDISPSLIIILGSVLYNLAIAVCEEFIFRGIILNSMMSAWRKRSNVIGLSIVCSCIVFGLRHLINLITMPDAVIMTYAQVVFTFMAGLYLCAVYLRTENIWICITIHFLEDFGTSIWTVFSSSAAASALQDGTIGAALGMIALQIPYVVFAILMLRDKKWSRDIITEKSSKGI